MIDLQTISIVLASVSVSIAAFYYAFTLRYTRMNMRNTLETRQTDILTRLHSTWGSEDLQRASWKVVELDFEDYDNFEKKYGPITEGTPLNIEIFRVGWFFNGLGVLVHKGLADVEKVEELFGYAVVWLWDKLGPIFLAGRKIYNQPRSLEWFEYLYNEMKKHQEQTSLRA